jgi:hypothetical protein
LFTKCKQTRSEFGIVWNFISGTINEIGGRKLLRRSLVEKIHELLAPDLLVLSAPGDASVLVFHNTASAKLKLVDFC